jgi:hypothetical protein
MTRRGSSRFGSTRRGLLLAVPLAGLLLFPSAALAAGPEIIRIPVDEQYDDGFLSEECGVPVVTTVQGFIAIRLFDRDTTGPIEVFTINLGYTARSPYGVARFRDVGADLWRITSDGRLLQQVMGQVPFQAAGVAKFDAETGELLQEPRDRSQWQLDKVCKALSGG